MSAPKLDTTHLPGIKLYESATDLIRQRLSGGDLERPVVIAGNGPSSATFDKDRLPPKPLVFRMNFFFLEQEPRLGQVVDGYFWSVDNPTLHGALRDCVRSEAYKFKTFFCPVDLYTTENRERNIEPNAVFQPQFDHWSVLSECPPLARLLASRPLPTQGMQVLGTALTLGYRDIHLVGIDFYQNEGPRYGYEIPAKIKRELDPKHYAPGYERVHSLDLDLAFLDTCVTAFPGARIQTISETPVLSTRLPRSPFRGRAEGNT